LTSTSYINQRRPIFRFCDNIDFALMNWFIGLMILRAQKLLIVINFEELGVRELN